MRTPEIRPGIRRLFRVFGRRDALRDADAEIRLHLELRTRQLIAEGMSPDEARAEAVRRFGAVDETRATLRQSNERRDVHARVRGWIDGVAQDLRYTFRTLRNDPGFTAFAVPTVALGVAASLTVFSLVSAVLLRPLPFRDAAQLVWVTGTGGDGVSEYRLQALHFVDLRTRTRSLADLAGYSAFESIGGATLSTGTDVQRFTDVPVTCNFFPVLGVTPILGRSFAPDECVYGAPLTVLLTENLWRRRFGAARDIVGRTIRFNDGPAKVIGVLPVSFDFASVFTPGIRADLFSPFPLSEQTNNYGNTLAAIGRLKNGTTVDQARTELVALGNELTAEYPRRNPMRLRVTALDQRINGAFRPALLTLAVAIGVVMLIVGANLSSLQYARGVSRQRELAVRLALGATRARLTRLALLESILVTGAGVALGFALSIAGVRVVSRLNVFSLPLLQRVTIDGWTVVVAVALVIVIGVGAALLPALQAPNDAGDSLRQQRGVAGDRHHARVRGMLVVCEIAAACVLLVGTGLLIRSFEKLMNQQLGYHPGELATVRIDPAARAPDLTRSNIYYDEVLRRVRAIPRVSGAGLSDMLPFAGDRAWVVAGENQVYARDQYPEAFIRVVSDGYFATMGIPLLSGRDFTIADSPESGRVVAVNQMLGSVLWPGRDPVGQTIVSGGQHFRVVAVVGNVRHEALEHAFTNEMYYPIRQMPDYQAVNLVVRSVMPLGTLAPTVRASLLPVSPNLPKSEWRSLQELVDAVASPRRFVVLLVTGFATFALLLAALGVYALVSYDVSQRRREIGIRIALGASATRVRTSVVSQTLRLASAGVVLGLASALIFGRLLRALLFGVGASDPASYATALVILAGVALIAGYVPAMRASRVDPSVTLRDG